MNVSLLQNSNVTSDPTSSLILSFVLEHGYPYYDILLRFVSDENTIICSKKIDKTFHRTTSITFETGSQKCSLFPSTTYYAIAQTKSRIINLDESTSFIKSSNVSLPSNLQVTGKN